MTTATGAARIFVGNRLVSHATTDSLLIRNAPELDGKLFNAVFGTQSTILPATSDFSPQTNLQINQFNNISISLLREYIGENRDHWNTIEQIL